MRKGRLMIFEGACVHTSRSPLVCMRGFLFQFHQLPVDLSALPLRIHWSRTSLAAPSGTPVLWRGTTSDFALCKMLRLIFWLQPEHCTAAGTAFCTAPLPPGWRKLSNWCALALVRLEEFALAWRAGHDAERHLLPWTVAHSRLSSTILAVSIRGFAPGNDD